MVTDDNKQAICLRNPLSVCVCRAFVQLQGVLGQNETFVFCQRAVKVVISLGLHVVPVLLRAY